MTTLQDHIAQARVIKLAKSLETEELRKLCAQYDKLHSSEPKTTQLVLGSHTRMAEMLAACGPTLVIEAVRRKCDAAAAVVSDAASLPKFPRVRERLTKAALRDAIVGAAGFYGAIDGPCIADRALVDLEPRLKGIK